MIGDLLPASFFEDDALAVAERSLGCVLVRGDVAVRIVEVEAYRHPGDTANHCRFGRTRRNAPMWGPPGFTYVYLCYGIHSLLNLVTGPEGHGAAVLIRGAEVLAGLDAVATRSGRDRARLAGPGIVGRALGLTPAWSNQPLFVPGGLELRQGATPRTVVRGPRVGIGYASAEDRAAPWRLVGGGWGEP